MNAPIKIVVLIILLFLAKLTKSATFVVSSNANTGANTLRQAIIDANASPGTDIINFNFGVATTITLTACQQAITGPVLIDGYSDPGASAGNLMIEVISPAGCRGFEFAAGSDGSTIRGIVISGGATGIYLNNTDGHTISGNYIGTNRAGTALASGTLAASTLQNGIHTYSSDNNTIGGTGGQIDRNIISGTTQAGVRLEGSVNAIIINNYIGTDASGNIGLGNGAHGVYGYNGSNNPRVGGTTAAERNVISFNSSHGIYFNGSSAPGTTLPVIKGNIIGMGVNGTTVLGNGASGINCEMTGACQIGGLTLSERNYVSNNGSFGVVVRYADNTVIEGNWIGVDMATGLLDYGNYDAAITVTNSADVRVGGSVAGAGNICSASGNPGGGADGISIWSTSPRPIILGNIIGLGADGVTSLQNYGHGIECLTCDDGIIGGPTLLERNLIAASFNRGIQLVNSPRVTVQNNYIGTDQTGLLDRGGSEMGISISNSADVVIGGTVPNTGNIISGNAGSGIEISGNSPNISMKGNIIGLGSDGLTGIPNDQFGIKITGNQANNCVVGGTTTQERNIVSSNGANNSHHALFIDGGTSGHSIVNNYVGTDINGTTARGNKGNGVFINNCNSISLDNNIVASNGADGVQFTNSSNNTIIRNKIGIDAAGNDRGNLSEGLRFSATCLDNMTGGGESNANIIAYNNGAAGVLLESSAQRNKITFNSIFCNTGPGIDLQGSANESVPPPGITTSGANSINGTGVTGDSIHVYLNSKSDGGVKCDCEGEIYIGKTKVAGGTWSVVHNLGLTATQAASVTATQTTVNNSTSEFTTCTSPLPVEFLNFDVYKTSEGTAQLNWNTAWEINNLYFIIERSLDGEHFEPIGTVEGNGTTSRTSSYLFYDYNLPSEVVYYRLKQVDFDGKFSYSIIRYITNGTETIQTYISEGKIWIKGIALETIQVNLYTTDGKSILSNVTLKSQPELFLPVPYLTKGIYLLTLNTSDGMKTFKLINL